MPSRRKAQAAFVLALILLSVSAFAVYLSISQLRNSEHWVVHTLEVQAAFGAVDSALGRMGRARNAFITSPSAEYERQFFQAEPEVFTAISHIRILTQDNLEQQRLCSELEKLVQQRIAIFQRSMDVARLEPQNVLKQNELIRENVPIGLETTRILDQMRSEERQLLATRTLAAKRSFSAVGLILVVSFCLALLSLYLHYRLLSAELKARQKAEQTVRESEERLRLVLESARMGGWDLDLRTGLCIRSEGHDAVFGHPVPLESWSVETMLDHVVSEDRYNVRQMLTNAHETGNFEIECRIQWPDLSLHWIDLHGRIYTDGRGKPDRIMGVVGDVSERKKIEEALLMQNAQLIAVNKELESFSYSVSHDLRSPLRAIDGFSLALMEDCEPKLSPEEKTHLQRIRAAANRMGELIDDLLDLAKTTRREMVREDVSLSELAEDIVSQFRSSGMDTATEYTVHPNMSVVGDRKLLHLALENLLDNARKFSAKHPGPLVEFGVKAENGQTVYFVRDNGIGFDMRYSNKLFHTFQRLHDEKDYPGTGVGLASVQRVIQRHGGRIWAESEPGHGATFFFTLDPATEKLTA